VVAVATVNDAVDAEDPPIGVPSIAPPLTSIVVKLAEPVEVNVPATAKVLPEPTLTPTLVPVPLATKSASRPSRSVLS
jgi:hypothetical protein